MWAYHDYTQIPRYIQTVYICSWDYPELANVVADVIGSVPAARQRAIIAGVHRARTTPGAAIPSKVRSFPRTCAKSLSMRQSRLEVIAYPALFNLSFDNDKPSQFGG